jgi:hypothetical protein
MNVDLQSKKALNHEAHEEHEENLKTFKAEPRRPRSNLGDLQVCIFSSGRYGSKQFFVSFVFFVVKALRLSRL